MNIWITYLIVTVMLVVAELVYFRIADRYNIIDKPNERSSHTKIVLRGGGVIFAISILVWMALQMVHGEWLMVQDYLPFIMGLLLIAGVSFYDDVHSLPDSVRLVAQFVAMAMIFYQLREGCAELKEIAWYWQVLVGIAALVIFVGGTNIFNFMDGINGITAGYSLAVLVPLMLVNGSWFFAEQSGIAERTVNGFVEPSLLVVVGLSVLVFSFFNFRPKNKAKCFAGDVGSVVIAFILLFLIGSLILKTGDVTWMVLLLVYGIDGCLTIVHRIMLHENLGVAHRKHAFQLMANELKMSHVVVSLIYMGLQLVVSLGFIYLCPDTVLAHWIYLICAAMVLAAAYVAFMKKYYHLHEEYLMKVKSEE